MVVIVGVAVASGFAFIVCFASIVGVVILIVGVVVVGMVDVVVVVAVSRVYLNCIINK